MIIFEKSSDVLCFTISGKITDEDYKNVLIPETEKALETLKHMGKLERLKIAVVISDDFEGVSIKAILDDIMYGFKNRKKFYKIGISGKHYKLQEQLVKIGNSMISGEMKIFADSKEMFKWLN